MRKVVHAATASERFNIAIVDPSDRVQYAAKAGTVQEAARVAEGHVRGKLR